MKVLSRNPLEDEIIALSSLLNKHKEKYSADPETAKGLVGVGNLEIPEELKPEALAPWVSVGSAILNLHETITRY